MTVVGALIIFMTFIAKDAVRDNLKDLLNSVDAAQNINSLHEDNTFIMDELRQIQEQLADSDGQGPRLPGTTRQLTYDSREFSRLVQQFRIATVALEGAGRLIELLGPDDTDRAPAIKVDTLAKDVQRRSITLGALLNTEGKELQAGQFSEAAQTAIEIHDALGSIRGMVDDGSKQIRDISDTVAKEAAAKIDVLRSFNGVATIISYVLYTVGWGLALLGRIYGADSSATADAES